MLRIGSLTGRRVLLLKKTTTAKDGTVTDKYQKLGKVRTAVFSPDGKRVVGLVVKRPDVAGMIKRADAFLAWDSFKCPDEKDIVVSRPKDGLDDAALRRLGLDWDRCIIWSGMDAKTTDGKSLGYVSDVEYDQRTGEVARFFTADGGMARALIGSFVITPDMVLGYRDGFMVVDARDRSVALDGGLAGAAGEGYARAKAGATVVGKKVGAAAGEAVGQGLVRAWPRSRQGQARHRRRYRARGRAACRPRGSRGGCPRGEADGPHSREEHGARRGRQEARAPRPTPRRARPRRRQPRPPRSPRPRRRATRSPAPPASSSAASARCSATSRASSTRPASSGCALPPPCRYPTSSTPSSAR